jgi:hypothetical protein
MIPYFAPLVFHTAPTVFPISFSVYDSYRHRQQQYLSDRSTLLSSDATGQRLRASTTWCVPASAPPSKIRRPSPLFPIEQEVAGSELHEDCDEVEERLHGVLLNRLVDHVLCCCASSSECEDDTDDYFFDNFGNPKRRRKQRRREPYGLGAVGYSHSLELADV